ncbi:trace amine-associated receptor 1-like [Anneissia japonica]|uniref:trace amine-associated receptor 1-like n=1 Tax=Anneissia japonica TaxID=1529436 RepID=UPI0014255507|nr:trace amine-associated receptor 1-like [Anneissia japonica]
MADYDSLNQSVYDDFNTSEFQVSDCPTKETDFTTSKNIALIFFGIIGIVGNGTVCIFVLCSKTLRKKFTYKLICNLALADFVASTYIIPQPVIKYEHNLQYEILCRIHGSSFPLWASFVASGICLLIITLDRYWAIVYPLRYISISTSRFKTKLYLALPWVYGILFQNFCVYTVKVDECGYCVLADTDRVSMGIIGFCTFTFTYLLPIIVILFLYQRILTNLRSMKASMKSFSQRGVAKSLSKTHNKLVKIFLFIAIFYTVTWAPDQIMFFAYTLGASVYKGTVYNEVIVLMAYMNSIMNPFVYAYSNDKFRNRVCIWRRGKQSAKSDNMSTRNTHLDSSRVSMSVIASPVNSNINVSQMSLATTISKIQDSHSPQSIDESG